MPKPSRLAPNTPRYALSFPGESIVRHECDTLAELERIAVEFDRKWILYDRAAHRRGRLYPSGQISWNRQRGERE